VTAVLVDAAFFLKRAARIYGHQTPEAAAKQLHRIALDHLNDATRPDLHEHIDGLKSTCPRPDH
jgi:hypothetical protein